MRAGPRNRWHGRRPPPAALALLALAAALPGCERPNPAYDRDAATAPDARDEAGSDGGGTRDGGASDGAALDDLPAATDAGAPDTAPASDAGCTVEVGGGAACPGTAQYTFESGADCWILDPSSAPGTSAPAPSCAAAYCGSSALAVAVSWRRDALAGGAFLSGIQRPLPVTDLSARAVFANVYVPGRPAGVQAQLGLIDDKGVWRRLTARPLVDGWNHLEATATPTAARTSAISVQLYLQQPGTFSGLLYVDDVGWR